MSTSVPSTYPPARFIESLGDYLTVDELAEYLQLSKETIYHCRLEGTGPKATPAHSAVANISSVIVPRMVNS
jgi:hypothetical protein